MLRRQKAFQPWTYDVALIRIDLFIIGLLPESTARFARNWKHGFYMLTLFVKRRKHKRQKGERFDTCSWGWLLFLILRSKLRSSSPIELLTVMALFLFRMIAFEETEGVLKRGQLECQSQFNGKHPHVSMKELLDLT